MNTPSKTISITASGLLSDALTAAGVSFRSPCGSRRSCGKCAVWLNPLSAELSPISAEEQAFLERLPPTPPFSGFVRRLACFCRAQGEIEILAPEAKIEETAFAPPGGAAAEYDGERPEKLGCAVDVGTTTVTLLLFILGSGKILAAETALNRQSVFGADVLSRITATTERGVAPLQNAICSQLDELLQAAVQNSQKTFDEIERVCITGNTTMLHLLLGLPVASLGISPFTPNTLFGTLIPPSSILKAPLKNAEIYLPPAISAFVGPDIICAILSTNLTQLQTPSATPLAPLQSPSAPTPKSAKMLVDVGTNGEMALFTGSRLLCCSTAAGPAFEGAEITCGQGALPGAIDAVWAKKDGSLGFSTIGNLPPTGVCGTGLISAISALLKLEKLDRTGLLSDSKTYITDSVFLTQADIRNLQLAKSAICAGIETLEREGTSSPEILWLAGGFGSALDPVPAAEIGLIPSSLAHIARPAGNAALAGAVLLSRNKNLRESAKIIANLAEEVPLATNQFFFDRYMSNLNF